MGETGMWYNGAPRWRVGPEPPAPASPSTCNLTSQAIDQLTNASGAHGLRQSRFYPDAMLRLGRRLSGSPRPTAWPLEGMQTPVRGVHASLTHPGCPCILVTVMFPTRTHLAPCMPNSVSLRKSGGMLGTQ